MNILFLQWSHLSESLNGASMYEHNMAKWLQSKGHEVQAVVYTTGNKSGVYDGVPYWPYSEHLRLVEWANVIITTPGKVRRAVPGKEVIYIQHNTNREPFDVSHGKVIYCGNHVRELIQYPCKEDHVLWPFNRFMDTAPLPPCPNGKVTLINCNANKGGRFLGELARQLPDVQFLGVHAGYASQITCKAPNIEYRTGEYNLREVLKDTAVLIMPSEKEGLPTLALEALSLGVPVLMRSIPAAMELGVIHADYKRFGPALRSMLDNYEDTRVFALSLALQHAIAHKLQLHALDWF